MMGDGEMAAGVSSDQMFSNTEDDEATKKAIAKEKEDIQKILPTAEAEIAILDRELADLGYLPDFVKDLGTMPSNLTEESVRFKLELRFAHMNQLLMRRGTVVAALQTVKPDYDNQPFDKKVTSTQVVTRVVETITVPRPFGWQAIRLGLKDLFRRKRM